jgi:signal transduction histidine kinase/DNA-binding LacI/PurR family transcriptional regulator
MILNAPPAGPEKFGSRDRQLTIGYLAPHAYGKISLEILSGIIQGAKDHGVNLVCISGGLTLTQFERKRDTLSAYRFINPRNLDGLIVWISALNYYIDESQVERFLGRFRSLPMVGIAKPVPGISTIIQDHDQTVRAVMQHIIGVHGFRKIVYIQGPETQYIGRARNQAFFQQLAEYGIPFHPDLIVTTRQFDKTAGNDGVRTLLVERGLRPGTDFEVIVACSDRIASGVIEELYNRGVKVPDTVSVVGFNNSPESLTYPALTTVEPHFYQHGYQAMESILALVHGGEFPEIIPIPGELIARESCGCIEEAVAKTKAVSDGCPGRYRFARKPFLKAVAEEREHILGRLRAGDGSPALPAERLDHLFDCFLRQLSHAGNEFLHALKKCLNDSSASQNHLGTWQNTISTLRKALLPYFDNPALLLKAEDIWNQARVMINLVAVDLPDSLQLGYIVNSNMMAQSIRLFTTASDLESLLATIATRIIQLNISFCCLVLYGEGDAGSGQCRLVLAIRDGKRMPIPDDCRVFERSLLLPERLLRDEPGRNLIVEPCVFEEDNLGYLVLQMNHVDGSLYESIRISVSMALQNTFHVRELLKTKEEKEHLYQVLRQQNAELEQRAIEVGQAYDRLKQAVEEARRANQAKSIFLANMSHEIRTPINCILGFAEILNDIEAGAERTEYQRKIVEESNRLLELINQLLDISKIEAGKLELHEEPFHLPDLLQGVSSTFEVIARNKGLTYQLELRPGLPPVVIGDALRLRQILVNLIGNAVKFTFAGGVRVRVAVRADQGAAIRLLFEIIDTGIGIPPNRVGAIFETFVQAEDSTTRKFGGTGLGTAISKQLVQMMGGEIGVDSEEGKGSNFYFTVAFKKPPAHEEAAAVAEEPARFPEPAFDHCRMLLVEDYPTNRMVVIAHLQKLNLAIEIAENGREAVEKFKAGRYDFILMDVQMPEMDGYEATRLIRGEPNGKTVPIVAMTASAFEQDIQQCLEAGMNDVITKPFRKDAFLEKITYWLTKGMSEE